MHQNMELGMSLEHSGHLMYFGMNTSWMLRGKQAYNRWVFKEILTNSHIFSDLT